MGESEHPKDMKPSTTLQALICNHRAYADYLSAVLNCGADEQCKDDAWDVYCDAWEACEKEHGGGS